MDPQEKAINVEEQASALDTVIGQSKLIGKIAHEIYKKMVQPKRNFQFKPLQMYKPAKLTLQSLKTEWETLINWSKKL